MRSLAPEYSGLSDQTVPCDGRALRVREYPEAFKRLSRNLQLGPKGLEQSNIYFNIPDKPEEISQDMDSFSELHRTFAIDLHTGIITVEVTKVEKRNA